MNMLQTRESSSATNVAVHEPVSRDAVAAPRPVVFRSRGQQHGPITRLASPGDLGQLLKPFVFLDLFQAEATDQPPRLPMHPHSGIATLTYLINGEVSYEDSTGAAGVLPVGGVEWMRAGKGVWHTGAPHGEHALLGFQLWVALPEAEELAEPQSLYLAPSALPVVGPATVLLGRYADAGSAIPAPSDMTYLGVRLKDGERWTYVPPAGHHVAWLSVGIGELHAGDVVQAGEIAIFKESAQPIEIVARGDVTFVLGSAVKHPHDLVTGHYSVHTSREALDRGEAEIRRLGQQLHREGRLG